MINKIRDFENNFSLNKAALTVAVFTVVSRLMGLVRDRLFASKFGAGDTLDVYYAAFRIPDFVFNLLILGTLSVAFIPVFNEWLGKDKKHAYEIANTILNSTFLGISAVCIILYFFAEPLTKLLVPGFNPEKLAQTTQLTKLFLLSPVIFTVSNVFGSILNANKKFLVVSFAPVLYNIGIIFGLMFLYPKYGLLGLGFGVILGALMHLGIQAVAAFSGGFRWLPILDFKNSAVRKISKLFLPRIFGMDNSQVSLLIGSVVGSVLASGSVAVFNLANNLQAVPLGVFAISIAIASFPVLSENFSQNKEREFSENLQKSIIQILFFLIPISILMLVLRAQVVRLAFGAGNFDWQDTILTFQALGIFCLSIFAQGLSPLLARAFYARQNTIIPVIVGLFSMVLNAGLAYFLGKAYGVIGVAAAFSTSAIVNCICLFLVIRFQLKDFKDSHLFAQITKILFSSAICGLAAYALLYVANRFFDTHTVLGLFLQFSVSAGTALIIFVYMAYLQELATAVYIINFAKKLFNGFK